MTTSSSVATVACHLIICALFHCYCCDAFGSYTFSAQLSPGIRDFASRKIKDYFPLSALTERQKKFWDDVERGLDDIEKQYCIDGKTNIDRIREFGKSARGEIKHPQGISAHHQPSEENVPGLSAFPFWTNTDLEPHHDGKVELLFPWIRTIEDNFTVIQNEFYANLREQSKFFSGDSAWQTRVMGDGWSAVRLQRLGEWNSKNCERFPKTYDLLRNAGIPFAVRGVCFARQAPESGVAPHSDGRNFILTAHLGIKIPKTCWLQVGKEDNMITWEEGKITVFDTSFVHSTGNPSSEERYVLIIDFWHPELTIAERAALTYIYDLRNKYDRGDIPPAYNSENDFQRLEQQFSSVEGGMSRVWNQLFGVTKNK